MLEKSSKRKLKNMDLVFLLLVFFIGIRID